VVVEVHLDVTGRDVNLVAALRLDAVVVGLLLVVLTTGEVVGAVVGRGDAAEAVLEGLLHLLVPLRVPNHLLLLGKNLYTMKLGLNCLFFYFSFTECYTNLEKLNLVMV